nr:uncharacterized protein K02A2.6-like [Aedes albopictus]
MEGYGPPRFALGDQWEMYQERLEQYFVAVDLEEERKSAVLLTSISLEVYQTVKNICYPAKPNTKTYDELCGLLKGRFCATVVTYRERALFYRARQEPDESVLEWHVRLKRLSLNCEFGEHLDHALKDIFVTGLRPGPIFERLCEEDDAVPLEDLLKIASKREATLKNRAVLEVNKIVEKKPNFVPKSFKKAGSATCYACGKANHDFRSCQYRSYVCKICKEKGHIAVVCPRKTKENLGRKDKTVNHLEINNMAYSDPYCVSISVNGRNTKFEVDTGSPITVISEEFYESQFGEFPLRPFQGKLVFYTGGEATPRGAFDAVLKYQGVQAVGQVVVVDGGRNPLIGRDFIGELLKIKFNKIDAEQTENLEERLKPVLNRYEDLFDDSLGCYKYSKVSLQLKPNAVPKFVKPRKIPISFQPKVEEELEKLEKTGIISKAENADWGTPLVPVLKKDNSIRLCADYRVTVNPFLEDKRYPMPVAEDIFAKLNGGKFFSKLDLKSAYNQLLLDEESKKMLAWSTHKGIYYVNRLPFGTKPACAIFQEILEKLLQDCPGCVNFLDDVLVTGATIEEHLNNLSRVLEKLWDAGFRLNKGVSNKVADFLSRSPVLCCEDDDINDEEAMYLQFIEFETRSLVERKQLIVETRRDPALSRVVNYVKTGWPTNVQDPELKKFFVRRTELIVEEEVLMWGYRIVAPAKLRTFLLQELHSTHMGIVKMKSLARNYFWWPNIDKDIEDLGKRCEQCIQFRPESGNVPISPWKLCSRPFERVHIDHLFLKNKNFLILTDSYSKWVEVYLVSSLTTKETIEKLEDCFGRFGNCDVLVSDNGRSFTAAEFQEFCKEKGIRHLTSAPYSPCSNGAAENAVKTFKYALKKMLTDSNSRAGEEIRLQMMIMSLFRTMNINRQKMMHSMIPFQFNNNAATIVMMEYTFQEAIEWFALQTGSSLRGRCAVAWFSALPTHVALSDTNATRQAVDLSGGNLLLSY